MINRLEAILKRYNEIKKELSNSEIYILNIKLLEILNKIDEKL